MRGGDFVASSGSGVFGGGGFAVGVLRGVSCSRVTLVVSSRPVRGVPRKCTLDGVDGFDVVAVAVVVVMLRWVGGVERKKRPCGGVTISTSTSDMQS